MDRSVGNLPRLRSACGAFVVGLLAACASEAPRPVRPEFDLRDPSATRRLSAIATVERTSDQASVPVLIEMLDDDDDGVRMAAGAALKNLTGRDTGYRAFAPQEERRAQIATWRALVRGATGKTPVGTKVSSSAPGGG